MPAAAVKPTSEDLEGEEDSGQGRLSLPSVRVSRELLRSFPHSKRVGSYLVGRMINKGSFAKVMEGLHIGTGEKVAIKVIDKKKARQDSYVLKNMKREPRIHQMIQHPHIVVLLETLETENSYYMAMELCAGGDLMDRICEKKRLEEREVRRYTRQILSAVEHLHKHGIVHRDLKIENFLLDEHNNIKIVDFGLSNTLRTDSVPLELLSTQCGSPAYAAPELLAHRKYGPKVDVWSIGVSMFAMLTGTLPFTVEPFNIKHLHQKMVNGEISSIPADISKGAVSFVMSLLEPDPEKRPTVREATEQKWVNEGYNKKPLHSVSHKNRLSPEDLNSSVLTYMTETLGYSSSEVTHVLTSNKPSSIMANYHLLLGKLGRCHKGAKAAKTEPAHDKSSKPPGRPLRVQQTSESPRKGRRTEDLHGKDQEEVDENCPPSPHLPRLPRSTSPSLPLRVPSPSPAALSTEGGATDEVAITVETRESLFPEVSVFAGRVHLSPPKSSASKLCDSAPCQVPPYGDPSKDGPTQHPIRTTQSDGATNPDCFHDHQGAAHPLSFNQRLEKLQTFYSSEKNAVSPRILQEAAAPSSDRGRLNDTTQPSPSALLPRLRNVGLKDGRGRKAPWVGLNRPGPPRLLINGSRPPAFLPQKQDRGKRKELSAGEEGAKRNPVQLRSSLHRRAANMNLPLLPAALQGKADRKSQLRNMEY
ncbi:Hormonally up-regulated neu tumor-associated kinase [Oryzias melastigma]|uniref:non-specific serine/threonine protein kinase n=1 Tax=Oryzias melastigma TaxID=30732 RepID=A0A834CGU3_ORYME|nr:Hormonally up-regulated neu tumor-associated kinase [Oryzias melastigma]